MTIRDFGKAVATALLAVALIGVAAFLAYNRGYRNGANSIAPQCDTLIVHDTLVQVRPQYVERRVVDTMWVALTDTLLLRDSVFVTLPREERVYEDSTYRAVVSGFRPSLDSIAVYPTTMVVTQTIREYAPRFGWGASGGLSALVDSQGQPHFGLGVTFGIYYRF